VNVRSHDPAPSADGALQDAVASARADSVTGGAACRAWRGHAISRSLRRAPVRIHPSYPGDANYNAASNAQASHTVQAPNVPPTAVDDPSYTMLEDGALNVNSGNGVLKNDTDSTTGRSRSSPGTPARRRMAASS